MNKLKNNTPKQIQELLNTCTSKMALASQLGVYPKLLNKFITANNLSYKSRIHRKPKPENPVIKKKLLCRESSAIPNDLKTPSHDEALQNFYKILTTKKEKRLLQELKDAYY